MRRKKKADKEKLAAAAEKYWGAWAANTVSSYTTTWGSPTTTISLGGRMAGDEDDVATKLNKAILSRIPGASPSELLTLAQAYATITPAGSTSV